MTLDTYAIATAIAARYAPGVMAPPAGLPPIRQATASPPNGITKTPLVLVIPDSGEVEHIGGGTRRMTHVWLVRFYLALSTDLARDYVALEKWTAKLLDAHLAGIALGGLVTAVRTKSYRVGSMRYGAKDYEGIELRVEAVTTEAWSPS
jgi:hypothetical protein